jgi:Transposase
MSLPDAKVHPVCAWFADRPQAWRDAVCWATLDLSSAYRVVFDTMLPGAVQVADPYHVVHLANVALDECRHRVQNETLGHRGRKDDPLYRCRRRLVMAREQLTVDDHERLVGLLRAGDPRQEVWFAWNANYPAFGAGVKRSPGRLALVGVGGGVVRGCRSRVGVGRLLRSSHVDRRRRGVVGCRRAVPGWPGGTRGLL